MSAVIQVNSEGRFVIVGEFSFDTVPVLYARGCELIAASPKPVFDLQHVTSSDNSGLTLLASLVRYAKHRGKAVIFINPPKQLSSVIQMSGLEGLLPLINGEKKDG
jgi:ABC-type transporter Mla MlaB component